MDTQNIINSVFEIGKVDWQYTGARTTAKGKEKVVVEGIPQDGFWKLWKKAKSDPVLKEGLRRAGVTLGWEMVAKGPRTTETGIESRSGGGYKVRTGARKAWQVTVWVNKANRDMIARLGFEIPTLEDSALAKVSDNPF